MSIRKVSVCAFLISFWFAGNAIAGAQSAVWPLVRTGIATMQRPMLGGSALSQSEFKSQDCLGPSRRGAHAQFVADRRDGKPGTGGGERCGLPGGALRRSSIRYSAADPKAASRTWLFVSVLAHFSNGGHRGLCYWPGTRLPVPSSRIHGE